MPLTKEQIEKLRAKYSISATPPDSAANDDPFLSQLEKAWQSKGSPVDEMAKSLTNAFSGLGPSASTPPTGAFGGSGIPTGAFGPTLEQRMQPRPEGESFGEFLKGVAKAIPGIPLDILQGAQKQQTQFMKETTPLGQEKMLPPSLEGPTGAEQIREVLPEGITQPLTPGQEAGYNTAMILSLLFPSIKKRGFTPIIEGETIGGMRRPPTRLPEIGEPNLPVVSEGALLSIGERIAKKRTERLVNKRVETLQKIEQGKAGLRNYIGKQKDRGFSPTEDIAKTDLLQGSVDNTGTVRTKQEGGAIDQYTTFIKPQEKVISKILEQEGATISLSEVEARLIKAVQESGMKGASRTSALSQVQREIEGYYSELNLQGKLPSDKVQIPISLIHDAKIDKYANINYMSESGRTDKLIAKQLKQLVEENTKSADVKALNEELARHYTNIGYLEKLDGAKVEGGRLGKHFARILGGMAGSSFGPLGTVVGAELAGGIKGKIMSSTFKKPIGGKLESSEAMKKALQSSKSEGARKMSQSPTIKATTTTSIEPNLTPKLPESKGVAGGTGNAIKQKIERRKLERAMKTKSSPPKGKGEIPETRKIQSIKQNGLLLPNEKGSGAINGIYAFTDKQSALSIAKEGGFKEVVSFKIPKDKFSKVVVDEDIGVGSGVKAFDEGSIAYKGNVPPEWITEISTADGKVLYKNNPKFEGKEVYHYSQFNRTPSKAKSKNQK